MRSSKASANSDDTIEHDIRPGLLGFDPDAVLLRDSSLLIDPQFVGALHAELRDSYGPNQARATLLQMGFLHGMQDALRAVRVAFEELGDGRATVVGPPLAIRMGGDGADEPTAGLAPDAANVLPRGAMWVHGSWPERNEAGAHLSAVGQPSEPVCFLSAGYTSGWLSGTLDRDVLAIETACSACGADTCGFEAREAECWLALGDREAEKWIRALPFRALRAYVLANQTDTEPPERAERFESDATVVHIWGPLMVIPFSGTDDALAAVDLIGHDPAARDVSVVIVDLSGAIIDDNFGALALEQVVDMIEAWGAEAVFAGVSPLSEAVVAELERQPLFRYKDLAQAIAGALQIADAQRSPA